MLMQTENDYLIYTNQIAWISVKGQTSTQAFSMYVPPEDRVLYVIPAIQYV